ncbi:sigma factor G inhibitor Gin [Paenibacillus mendelii]|uniref:Sigma factor G inhibitor Gin n=1 Tax=Paenibacillus mendelii TaxID=206163 RepID=A0ABV6JMB1_9BACL|nr:sigma factor G inhibitor Gin [Paenibacillus mendelii]MCQ6563752.1 sigma factor G inhibitor Gin [Paenibacillus mendelii]
MEENMAARNFCIICGHDKTDGIRIIDEFICEACETEMVETDVQDAKYPFFIHQLRRIWMQKNA